MDQVDPNSTRRKGLWATLAIAAATGASAVTIALPATSYADPEPRTTAAPAPVAHGARRPAPATTSHAPAGRSQHPVRRRRSQRTAAG